MTIPSFGVIIYNKIVHQYQGYNRNLKTQTVVEAVLYFGAGAGVPLRLMGQFISTFAKKHPGYRSLCNIRLPLEKAVVSFNRCSVILASLWNVNSMAQGELTHI